MRTKYLILFIPVVMIFSQRSFSQGNDRVILKFSPLSLIDPYGENIHIGSEFISRGPLSVETDFAAYIRIWNRDDDTPRIKDRTGFKIKPEIRYYLKSGRQKTFGNNGFYIADELYFISDRFKRGDTFVHYDQVLDTNYYYFDYERIRRLEIGNNIKIGYQFVSDIKLTLDFYLGLGVKYHYGKFDYNIPDPPCCPIMRFFEIPVTKGLKPGITFGIKLGYAL